MILWITGNSGAGKTTLAEKILPPLGIHLDGDDIRERITGFDLSGTGRREHNLNTAKWAKLLSDQGFDVVVSMICPFEDLREEVKQITGCKFLYLEYEGDDKIPDKPYEKPVNPEYRIQSYKGE